MEKNKKKNLKNNRYLSMYYITGRLCGIVGFITLQVNCSANYKLFILICAPLEVLTHKRFSVFMKLGLLVRKYVFGRI